MHRNKLFGLPSGNRSNVTENCFVNSFISRRYSPTHSFNKKGTALISSSTLQRAFAPKEDWKQYSAASAVKIVWAAHQRPGCLTVWAQKSF